MKPFFLVLLLCNLLPAAVAVLPFSSSDSTKNGGFDISEHIMSFMAQSGYVSVVDRNNVAKIAEEISFSQSEMVDVATAVEAGKLIGADKIVVGSFVQNPNGIKVQARVVEVATGVILGATIKEGKKASEVLDQVSAALLDYFGVKATINSGYKAKKIIGFTSLGIAAGALAGGFIFNKNFATNQDDSKKIHSSDEYAKIEKDGTFNKTARWYAWGSSAAFAGLGIALIASAHSSWYFEKRETKVSFAPLYDGNAVGASMKVVF